jgi:cytochrome c oxidase cbb3-type subunit 1
MTNPSLPYAEHHQEPPEVGVQLRIEVDRAARAPINAFFVTGVFWLLLGSVLALIASIKLHVPGFLADSAWLTFGRVRPAHLNTVIYGWSSAACIGVGLWLMSRLCRTPIRHRHLLFASVVLWNIGNAIGLVGVLGPWSTSVEWLEYPPFAAVILTVAFVPVMIETVSMVRRRQPGHVYVSQWYILAGVFWFPWLYATVQVLLFWHPVSGPAQPAVNWWFAHNVLGLWFTPVGLAAAYYLIPKVTGKPIHSYYLSMVGFWSLAFFYAWNGMHHLIGGPFPAWLISVSVVASVMMFVPVITVAVNHHLTMRGNFAALRWSPTLRFVVFAAIAYTLTSFQGSLMAIRSLNRLTHFTHYTVAHAHLGMYAFVSMMMFGAIYYIVPRLTGREWPSARAIKAHFWLCGLGIIFYWVGLTIGGLKQGLALLDSNIPFMATVKLTLPYLELRSWAGTMMTLGHFIFAWSLWRILAGRTPATGKATLLAPQPNA